MAISVSYALLDAMLDTGPFNTLMAPCFLKVYDGGGSFPVNSDQSRPNAEAAVVGDLLATYTNNATETGLTWAAAADGNVIGKPTAEVWKTIVATGGTATYFRFVLAGDTGLASTTDYRIQGIIGQASGDLLISDTTFVAAQARTINSFFIVLG